MKSEDIIPLLFIVSAITGAYFLYAFILSLGNIHCDQFSCPVILALLFLVTITLSVLLLTGSISLISVLIHKTTMKKNKTL
jgi:uncharacterized membrane protein YesL